MVNGMIVQASSEKKELQKQNEQLTAEVESQA